MNHNNLRRERKMYTFKNPDNHDSKTSSIDTLIVHHGDATLRRSKNLEQASEVGRKHT